MRTSKNSPAEEAKLCRCLQEYLMYFFNQTFIESLLTFSSACWFSGLSVRDKKKNCLKNTVKACIKITGARLNDLCSRWKEGERLRKQKE